MKSEKFMRRRIAAGILAVMTAVTPALPVQVAAQGLVGIGTGKQDDIQTEEKGGMKEERIPEWETGNTSGAFGMETKAGSAPEETAGTEENTGSAPEAAGTEGTSSASEAVGAEGTGSASEAAGTEGTGNAPETAGTEEENDSTPGSSGAEPMTEEASGSEQENDSGESGAETSGLPDAETETTNTENGQDWWEDTDLGTEMSEQPGNAEESGAETGADAEPGDRVVLADTNGDTEVFIFLKEGELFAEDVSFRVLCIADVIGETEEKEMYCKKLEDALLAAWDQALLEKTVENVQIFLPYYLLLTDAQGAEISLPGEAEIRLTICDEDIYQTFWQEQDSAGASAESDWMEALHIAWQGRNDAFREIPGKRMILDDEKHSVTFVFETEETGWFSLLYTEEEADTPETESSDGQAETPGGEAESEMTEDSSETGTESDTESGQEADVGLESLKGVQLLAARAALSPSGNLVTASGSGFRLMSTSELDGTYRAATWYSGISSFEPFNTAGGAVKTMTKSDGDIYIFYPTNDASAGKFGGVYQKILFKDGVWYDLKMTVTAYTNKTYAGSDGAEVPSYPPMGFSRSKIAWYFMPIMGEYIMKMEYFKHGDAKQKAVAVNSRFQWWEIDNSQRFGIRTGNGSIAKKFYQSANSTVYYKSQVSKADGNTYLFVTASRELLANDTRGNVGFVLQNCSTYYVAIGYRDHIQDSSDYRVSKAGIEKRNESLKNGKPDEVTLGLIMQSDVDVPVPMDSAYPKKYVSNDGVSWEQTNTLPKITSEYYYKIEQYIPWQTPGNYYEKLVIEDVLPAGVDYVGSMKITCLESGKSAAGSFQCVQKNDTVSITPVNLKSAALYGRTYTFVFKVRMDPEEIKPTQTKNTAVYKVVNTAALACKHSGQTAVSMTSNKVTTQASVQRTSFAAPVKGLDQSESVREKQLTDAGETIVFSVFQTVPHNEEIWKPVQMELTDELEPCLEYVSAKVFSNESGKFTAASQWKTSVSGQKVVISCDFKKNPPAPDNQKLRFDITCRLKEGYDCSAYEQIAGNRRWYVVPNKARMKTVWAQGSPLYEEKETNIVTVKLPAGAVEAQIVLTKEIDAADIVWAHGNPTFTFCISGEDVLGKRHTYYRTVAFMQSNAQNTGKASESVSLTVPAGWYTVSEEKTMRYRLESIHSITNGILSGETAVLDVSKGQTGSAVFYNQKTTDEGESHSAFVRNEIKNR